MKFLLPLAIILVVLVSLCINIPFNIDLGFDDNQDDLNLGPSMIISNQDISLVVSYNANEVKVGRDVYLSVELANNQNYDLENVVVEIYDNPCFTPQNVLKEVGTLRAGAPIGWSQKLEADDSVIFERMCPIRFKVSYSGKYDTSRDIIVLSEEEYLIRENEGTLNSIYPSGNSSISPMSISISFSEEQPFMEGQDYYMYVSYNSLGTGTFEDITVDFTPPPNIDFSCSDYLQNNQLSGLNFVRGKAPSTVCSFTARSVDLMEIQKFRISAEYDYSLYGNIEIRVSP